MEILFILIPISIIFNFAVLIFLRWAIYSNQFEKLDNESRRILKE